jgi:hypothetical protein
MSGGLFGFIEIIFFYGIAIGFGVYQIWKTDKELKKTRAEREAREAKEAEEAAAEGKAATSPHEASDTAA